MARTLKGVLSGIVFDASDAVASGLISSGAAVPFVPETPADAETETVTEPDPAPVPAPRKRGRPPKNRPAA